MVGSPHRGEWVWGRSRKRITAVDWGTLDGEMTSAEELPVVWEKEKEIERHVTGERIHTMGRVKLDFGSSGVSDLMYFYVEFMLQLQGVIIGWLCDLWRFCAGPIEISAQYGGGGRLINIIRCRGGFTLWFTNQSEIWWQFIRFIKFNPHLEWKIKLCIRWKNMGNQCCFENWVIIFIRFSSASGPGVSHSSWYL